MFNQFIEVFKTGTHTDGHGHSRTWTDADLQQFIDNHDPKHAAPIVLGHPKSHADNYGQVDQLKIDNGVLSATFKNINPTFEKIVASGEIANRSIRAKKTDNGWTLDHIGFLGQSRPAVSDLAPMFSQPDYPEPYHDYLFAFDIHEVEINPYRYQSGMRSVARLFRRVRDFIIDKHDLETANEVIPDWSIEHVDDAEDAIKPKPTDKDFSTEATASNTGGTMPDNKSVIAQFRQADIDAAVDKAKTEATAEAEAQFADQLREVQQAQKATETRQQVKDFVAAGKITPAQASGMSEFIVSLDDQTEYVFAKGDDTGKTKASTWFAEFVGGLNAGIRPGSLGDDVDMDCEFSAQQIASYAKEHGVDPVTALEQLKSGDK